MASLSDAAVPFLAFTEARRRYDRPAALLAMVALCQPGGISMLTTPALLAAFTASGRFSTAQAAMFGSAELAGMTLGILLTSLIVGRVDRRLHAALALALGIAGHALTILAASRGDPGFALLARGAAGVGEGGLTGVAVAAIAGLSKPDRGFGLAIPGNLLGAAVIFTLTPRLMAAGGLPVLLTVVIGYCVIFGLAIPLLPRRAVPIDDIVGSTRPKSSWTALAPGLLGLCGTTLFLTGIGDVWPITAQIGRAHGVGAGAVASTLSIAGLAGAGAGLAAAWVGGRLPRLPSLIAGSLLAAAAMIWLVAGPGFVGFAVGAVTLMVGWVFSVTFYFGMLATMDLSGRLVAVSTALQTFGLGLGQALAAGLAGLGYAPVGVVGAALVLSAALVMMLAARSAARVA